MLNHLKVKIIRLHSKSAQSFSIDILEANLFQREIPLRKWRVSRMIAYIDKDILTHNHQEHSALLLRICKAIME
jgi:hypothetical protein